LAVLSLQLVVVPLAGLMFVPRSALKIHTTGAKPA
jgi:hypothetical protein